MNRAERRRAKKKGINIPKEPMYNMRKSDIQSMKKESVDEATNTAIILLLALPIRVLREQYGWGSKRLPEFAEKLAEEYQNFAEDDITLEEYAEEVYQWTGIKFKKGENK